MYPLAVVFAQSIEARCQVENEDVVGAAPTGDAPTTSALSTILLPTKVRLILEVVTIVAPRKRRILNAHTVLWQLYLPQLKP